MHGEVGGSGKLTAGVSEANEVVKFAGAPTSNALSVLHHEKIH